MSKPTPCLWFDGNAEEAVTFYTKLFKNSRVLKTTRWGDTGPGPKGSVLTMTFKLDGQEFMALNGGPQYKFTPAVSFSVMCKTQREIDKYWTALSSHGGQEVQCGWVTDRFGLSWQIVPEVLPKLLADKNAGRRDRAMRAMMGMVKLDIAALKKAAAGK